MAAPTLMSSAFANLAKAVTETAGITVTVRDANLDPATLKATVDVTSYDYDDSRGVLLTWVATDFFVRPKDWEFGAGAVEPQDGDTISFTDEFGVARVYEVRFVPNERPFKVHPHGHSMTVHTIEK